MSTPLPISLRFENRIVHVSNRYQIFSSRPFQGHSAIFPFDKHVNVLLVNGRDNIKYGTRKNPLRLGLISARYFT